MKPLLEQLRQLWSQLGINQRVTVAVASVAVVIGMVGLVVWSQRPQMQLLYGRLSPKDMSAVVASLQELGVKNEMGANGTAIYVPSDQVHKVRMSLAGKGIPSGEGVGFEIFDRANFGVSDFIQRTNYNRALQGELARTISQMQGVRNARVLVVTPENRLVFAETKTKPTASVFIEGSLNQEQVNSIRFLVANAVEGLKTEDVSVIDHRGQVLTEGLKDDPALGAASGQMRLRRTLEDYYANKVESMLTKVLGPNKSVVRVSVDLDSEAVTQNKEVFDPDGQVLRTETTTDDRTDTSETEKADVVGSTANVAQPNAEAQAPSKKTSNMAKKQGTKNFEINKTVISSVKAPGSVSGVSAAVIVSAEALKTVKAVNTATDPKVMLRDMVANALGIKKADAATRVSIEEMPFQDTQPEPQGFLDSVMRHSDLVRDAGAVLVAIVLFAAFVRMLRRTKPDEIPMEALYPPPEGEGARDGGDGSGIPNTVTVELINEMIRRKPENVSAALRNWVSEENK